MHQTSRISVLSNRIPRALVFIYFCRALLEDIERRPTCHVYNEIITCREIFLNLEDPEATGTNGRPDGLGGGAPALPPWAPAQVSGPIRTKLLDRAPPT